MPVFRRNYVDNIGVDSLVDRSLLEMTSLLLNSFQVGIFFVAYFILWTGVTSL